MSQRVQYNSKRCSHPEQLLQHFTRSGESDHLSIGRKPTTRTGSALRLITASIERALSAARSRTVLLLSQLLVDVLRHLHVGLRLLLRCAAVVLLLSLLLDGEILAV